MCQSGCIEHRLGCIIESRNFIECVDMGECEARDMMLIIIACACVGVVLLIVFYICCLSRYIRCGKKKEETAKETEVVDAR